MNPKPEKLSLTTFCRKVPVIRDATCYSSRWGFVVVPKGDIYTENSAPAGYIIVAGRGVFRIRGREMKATRNERGWIRLLRTFAKSVISGAARDVKPGPKV